PRQPSRSGRHEGTAPKRGTPDNLPATKKRSATERSPLPSKTSRTISSRMGSKKTLDSYNPLAPERLHVIFEGLDRMYPGVTCALTHRSAWELVVATILSAQSTDVRVNMVTPELFRKYPTVQDFAALEPEQLQPDIYSTGFFRNKAKSV